METKFISLTSANREDNEGNVGFETVINVSTISNFHKAERRESGSHVHFVDGKAILVTQSVEEIKSLLGMTPSVSNGDYRDVI